LEIKGNLEVTNIQSTGKRTLPYGVTTYKPPQNVIVYPVEDDDSGVTIEAPKEDRVSEDALNGGDDHEIDWHPSCQFYHH
jgi:hypothetical protein